MEQEVRNVIKFLLAEGKDNVKVSYGWGCELDQEDLYRERLILLSELENFIKQSTVSGVFTFGEGDLYLNSEDEKIGFVLCHESDIHVTTDDQQLAQKVTSEWEARGYACHVIGEPQPCAG